MRSGQKPLPAIPQFSKCYLPALTTLESMNEKGETLLEEKKPEQGWLPSDI